MKGARQNNEKNFQNWIKFERPDQFWGSSQGKWSNSSWLMSTQKDDQDQAGKGCKESACRNLK
jgi:hypothetical protein